MSSLLSNYFTDFDCRIFTAAKHLSERGLVDLVQNQDLPFGRAWKIRKVNIRKPDESDRSTVLTKSIVILSSRVMFYTGRSSLIRHGSYVPSIPGGNEASLLGIGTSKAVFQVLDLNSRQHRAIGVPLCKITASIYLNRMKNEDLMTRRVESLHILSARYFSARMYSGREMGYLESEVCLDTLAKRLALDPQFLGKHPHLVDHVAKAVTLCHEAKITHGDVQTKNIFLIKDASGMLFAKLADFGEAKEISEEKDELEVFEEASDVELDQFYLNELEKIRARSLRQIFLR